MIICNFPILLSCFFSILSCLFPDLSVYINVHAIFPLCPIIFLLKYGVWATDWYLCLVACGTMEKRYFTAIQHAADCVLKQLIFWWRKDNQLAPIWAKMQGTKIAACTIFVNWYKHSNSAVQESFWESVSFLLSMLSFIERKLLQSTMPLL